MSISKITLVLIMVAVLLVTVAEKPVLSPVRGQSQAINLSQEYSSGDVQVFSNLQAWYTWVNINGTHTIFLALHSQQLPSPVSAFVGQGYNTSSGSRIFVANALIAMEVYNDTDGNGFLDANYAVGTTELRYTLIMNASQTFTTTAVQKTTNNGVPHYKWGVTYGSVQAILIRASSPNYGYGGGMAASYANIDHVTMSYDYSLVGNTTFLKTSYDIGTVTLTPPTDPGVTLQGLSLSLLHTTLTVASKQFTILANNSPYDSQTSTSPALVNAAGVSIENGLVYEFRFRDNYTLLKNPAVTYPVLYVASPSGSLPTTAYQGQWLTSMIRVEDYVRSSLPDFVGLPNAATLNYNSSKLIYRISYSAWSGYGLSHDPTYVTHFVPLSITSRSGPTLPIAIISIAIITGLLGVVFSALGFRRRNVAERVDAPENNGSGKNDSLQ